LSNIRVFKDMKKIKFEGYIYAHYILPILQTEWEDTEDNTTYISLIFKKEFPRNMENNYINRLDYSSYVGTNEKVCVYIACEGYKKRYHISGANTVDNVIKLVDITSIHVEKIGK